jgi:hypothetical protein
MAAAYQALEAADYAALPDLISRLDAAFAANPEQGRLAFYAGTMRLWQATGGPRQPGERLNDVLGAIEKLERASELGPQDPHAHAFLAIAHVSLGSVLRDEKRIDTGQQIFDDSIALYPPYVHGVRAQAFGSLPRDHRYFPNALESVYASLTACGSAADPAEGLDIVYPSASDTPPGTCWNGGIVQHTWEGILLIFGDVAVKSGDAELGRTLYRAAELSPTFDTFLFGNELESRINEADERAALYLDDDRYNDPPTWMDGQSLCVGCHASKP